MLLTLHETNTHRDMTQPAPALPARRSIATVALASAHLFDNPLAVMAASRCVFGLASAVALPAVSAGVSALVPKKRRGRMLSYIYATFNVGSILGVAATPPLVRRSPCGPRSRLLPSQDDPHVSNEL